MPTPRFGSGFQPLEDRLVPHAFGTPWPDAQHLTLSLVPDGTPTQLGGSGLTAALNAAAAPGVWQRELLRAFQTWAAYADINIGLTGDSGAGLGSAGAVQGDSRFGDIRVAAAPLGADAGAHASPFSWTGTTFAGDVVLNSNYDFAVGATGQAFDLYSVALHEAGHALGLPHSDDPASVMFEDYAPHTGLGSADIAAVRALYGPRRVDEYDAAGANSTRPTASPLSVGLLGGTVVADAGLTTGDVDFYRFAAPLLGGTGKVVLQAAGLSLLTAKVTVYNPAGAVVATASAADPRSNDVTVQFQTGLLGGTYYAKVEGVGNDAFATGAYRLTVTAGVVQPLLAGLLAPVTDGGLNDTLAAATGLLGLSAADSESRFDATYRGKIESAQDTDFYRIKAPNAAGGLNVIAWGTGAVPFTPRVHVFDAAGAPVAFKVLANEAGLFSVQVPTATPGANYVVQVLAREAGRVGGYVLGLDFNEYPAPEPTVIDSAALDPATSISTAFTATTAGVFQFGLTAFGPTGGVEMTLTTATGAVLFTLEAWAGQPVATATRNLPVGPYTVTYRALGVSGVPSAADFDLAVMRLSDNVGPYASSTTKPSGGSSTASNTGNGYTYAPSTGTQPTRTKTATGASTGSTSGSGYTY